MKNQFLKKEKVINPQQMRSIKGGGALIADFVGTLPDDKSKKGVMLSD